MQLVTFNVEPSGHSQSRFPWLLTASGNAVSSPGHCSHGVKNSNMFGGKGGPELVKMPRMPVIKRC